MAQVSAFGIGKLLAIIGLVLTVIFIAIAHIALLPFGLLFLLAFLAILL